MSISLDQLHDFHHFAEAKLRSEDIESLDELFELWRIELPTPDEAADVHQGDSRRTRRFASGAVLPGRGGERGTPRQTWPLAAMTFDIDLFLGSIV